MAHIIITKWIEPYVLLETIKKYFSMTDYTFDGTDKIIKKNRFLKELQSCDCIGLYMKNVNKFYLFKPKGSAGLDELIKEFNFTDEDYIISDDNNMPFDMIDTGKAEASYIRFLKL